MSYCKHLRRLEMVKSALLTMSVISRKGCRLHTSPSTYESHAELCSDGDLEGVTMQCETLSRQPAGSVALNLTPQHQNLVQRYYYRWPLCCVGLAICTQIKHVADD